MKKAAQIAALFCSFLLLQGCTASETGSTAENQSAAGNESTAFSPEKAFAETVCTADAALEWATAESVVVMKDCCCTSGKAVWNAFFEAASAGKAASVLCASYYELHPEHMSEELYEAEKDQYPVLYFSLIDFDGQKYRLQTRSSSETTLTDDKTYQYLVHLTGENPASALYQYTDEYDLVDDPDVTLEQLQRSMFSSQSSEFIRFSSVFTDMHN